MNLGEIIDAIKSVSAKETTNDLDRFIPDAVNRAYRKLCRARTFGQLIIRGEQFTTVSDTFAYVLPYPLERIINDSLRYDVTSTMPGNIINVITGGSTSRTLASALYPAGSYPVTASLGQNVTLSNQYLGAFVNVNSDGDTVTAGSVPFDATMVGKYIRFGNDKAGHNGGDYGYKITDFASVTEVDLLERPYRGPALTSASYEITPVSSLWLTFDPAFIDTAKTVQYDWYSKPQRLYSMDDIPEVPELSDAIVYRVLADNPIYHRPESYDRMNYDKIAREELISALKPSVQ